MTPEDDHIYNSASVCYLCGESFTDGDMNYKKVADHDHLTSLFRGAAHSLCNLKLRLNPSKLKLPCIFHNLKGYDSHFIMQFVNPTTHGKVTVIPTNFERYIGFTIGRISFKDSLSFLIQSLDQLASNLDDTQFPILRRHLHLTNAQQFQNTFTFKPPVYSTQLPPPPTSSLPPPPPPPPQSTTTTTTTPLLPTSMVPEPTTTTSTAATHSVKPRKKKHCTNVFINMECEVSGDDSDGDADDEGDGNIDNLIDDDTYIPTDISMYHRLHPSSPTLPPTNVIQVNHPDDTSSGSSDDDEDCDIDSSFIVPDRVSVSLLRKKRRRPISSSDSDADEPQLPPPPVPASLTSSSSKPREAYATIQDLPTNDYRHHPFTLPALNSSQVDTVNTQFKLLRRKGVFPYSYITNLQVLNQSSLPPQSAFFDSLRDAPISDSDYEHAQQIFETFNTSNLKDYSNLYRLTDILLLADIFENFRNLMLDLYQIDPLFT